MSIFVIGDTHGKFGCIEEWLYEYANQGDTLISVGDFGSMTHPKRLESLGNKLVDKGVTCLANRGNHSIPLFHSQNKKFGGLEFAPDYSIKNIEGERFLFLGGAVSVDRSRREEGRDWFAGEEFNLQKEKIKLIRNVDYVISHACPNFAAPFPVKDGGIVDYYSDIDRGLLSSLKKEGRDMKLAFDILSQNNKIKKWIFGHWHTTHRREQNSVQFRCLDIDEMIML